MTFIYNNISIILMSIPMLILVIVFIWVMTKLPEMLEIIPYHPPIPPDKFKRLRR